MRENVFDRAFNRRKMQAAVGSVLHQSADPSGRLHVAQTTTASNHAADREQSSGGRLPSRLLVNLTAFHCSVGVATQGCRVDVWQTTHPEKCSPEILNTNSVRTKSQKSKAWSCRTRIFLSVLTPLARTHQTLCAGCSDKLVGFLLPASPDALSLSAVPLPRRRSRGTLRAAAEFRRGYRDCLSEVMRPSSLGGAANASMCQSSRHMKNTRRFHHGTLCLTADAIPRIEPILTEFQWEGQASGKT